MQRDFKFMSERDEDGDLVPYDRDSLLRCLVDLEGTLAQVGGIVTVAAVRVPGESKTEGETIGVHVKYDTFSPFANSQRQRPEPVSEPVAVSSPVEEPDFADDDEDAPVAPVGAE